MPEVGAQQVELKIGRYQLSHAISTPNQPWTALEPTPMGPASVCDCGSESAARRVAAGLAVLDLAGDLLAFVRDYAASLSGSHQSYVHEVGGWVEEALRFARKD